MFIDGLLLIPFTTVLNFKSGRRVIVNMSKHKTCWKASCTSNSAVCLPISVVRLNTHCFHVDTLRRTFYRWLSTARVAHHRRVILQEREDELRLRKMEVVWDRWREKTLRSRVGFPLSPCCHLADEFGFNQEDQILLQCQRNILCRVFAKWNSKTLAPPAIRFDSRRVRAAFFKQWKAAMSQTHKVKEAMNAERKMVTSRYFETWVQRYRAKKTLQAVA